MTRQRLLLRKTIAAPDPVEQEFLGQGFSLILSQKQQ